MEVVGKTKGLDNEFGENNCFLNVVIQALWHLKSFRTKYFGKNVQHKHIDSVSCVYCALQTLFSNYEYGDESHLPPKVLRDALDAIYKSEEKFQLGQLDDAAEALEAVLGCLHNEVDVSRKSEHADKCHCIAHRVFGLRISELVQCRSCSTNSKPFDSTCFIYYTYISAISSFHQEDRSLPFSKLMRRVASNEKSCDKESCGQKNPVHLHLHKAPEVFVIGLVWPCPDPDVSDILDTLALITLEGFVLNDIFSLNQKATYELRGMICYYRLHYDAYFRVGDQWHVFDDATHKNVGNWDQVRTRCRMGRFHPSVLFYEMSPGCVVEPVARSGPVASAVVRPSPAPTHQRHSNGARAPVPFPAAVVPVGSAVVHSPAASLAYAPSPYQAPSPFPRAPSSSDSLPPLPPAYHPPIAPSHQQQHGSLEHSSQLLQQQNLLVEQQKLELQRQHQRAIATQQEQEFQRQKQQELERQQLQLQLQQQERQREHQQWQQHQKHLKEQELHQQEQVRRHLLSNQQFQEQQNSRHHQVPPLQQHEQQPPELLHFGAPPQTLAPASDQELPQPLVPVSAAEERRRKFALQRKDQEALERQQPLIELGSGGSSGSGGAGRVKLAVTPRPPKEVRSVKAPTPTEVKDIVAQYLSLASRDDDDDDEDYDFDDDLPATRAHAPLSFSSSSSVSSSSPATSSSGETQRHSELVRFDNLTRLLNERHPTPIDSYRTFS